MKSTWLFAILILAGVVALVYFSQSGGQTPEEYIAEIEQDRKAKDEFMKSDNDSPFAGVTEAFHALRYFPPDLKYKIRATLVPIDDKKIIALPTSDGLEKKYLEYALAEFTLDGQTQRLIILEITDGGPYRGTLFLAFADETSARETYGAGRYIDLKKTAGATSILLDFNKAYNPYCAYSDKFSCPFPPPGNLLTIAIRAGEKSYH